jgi:hypothetical protein
VGALGIETEAGFPAGVEEVIDALHILDHGWVPQTPTVLTVAAVSESLRGMRLEKSSVDGGVAEGGAMSA